MNKKILIITFLCLTLVTLTTGCGCSKKDKQEDNENVITVNKNKSAIEDKIVEVFKFTDTSIIHEKNEKFTRSTITANLTNTSEKDEVLYGFKIEVYKDDEIIVELTGYIGEEIKAGETKPLTTFCGEDLSNATDIKYSVIRENS